MVITNENVDFELRAIVFTSNHTIELVQLSKTNVERVMAEIENFSGSYLKLKELCPEATKAVMSNVGNFKGHTLELYGLSSKAIKVVIAQINDFQGYTRINIRSQEEVQAAEDVFNFMRGNPQMLLKKIKFDGLIASRIVALLNRRLDEQRYQYRRICSLAELEGKSMIITNENIETQLSKIATTNDSEIILTELSVPNVKKVMANIGDFKGPRLVLRNLSQASTEAALVKKGDFRGQELVLCSLSQASTEAVMARIGDFNKRILSLQNLSQASTEAVMVKIGDFKEPVLSLHNLSQASTEAAMAKIGDFKGCMLVLRSLTTDVVFNTLQASPQLLSKKIVFLGPESRLNNQRLAQLKSLHVESPRQTDSLAVSNGAAGPAFGPSPISQSSVPSGTQTSRESELKDKLLAAQEALLIAREEIAILKEENSELKRQGRKRKAPALFGPRTGKRPARGDESSDSSDDELRIAPSP